MSEFSSSFHYLNKSQDEVIKLHSENGIKSYIFNKTGRWVSALVDPNYFNSVTQCNNGIMLEYHHVGDHGWELKLHDDSNTISVYNCMWGDDIFINDSELNKSKLIEILDLDEFTLTKILNPKSFKQIIDSSPAYSFAELIGLKYFSWLSYDYLDPENLLDESFGLEDFTVVS